MKEGKAEYFVAEDIETKEEIHVKIIPPQPEGDDLGGITEEERKKIYKNEEDLGNKITKFYASNQGETHLADSDNGKIMDMMLYGRSEQKQYSGKNLLELSDNQVQNGNLKFQISQGIITFSGSTDNASFNEKIKDFIVPSDGTYTISTNSDSNNESPRILISINGGSFENALNGVTKELTTDDVVSLYIRIATIGSYDGRTIKPMIEKGSEVTSYEPYTGGQPSPSPDYPQEIKSVVNPTVKVCGKNLLQPNIKFKDRVKINIKKGTRLTLICKNGVVSRGGNLKFGTADGNVEWFGFEAGAVKQQILLRNNVVSFEYLLHYEPSESYALYIGDENTYEPYKEQSVQLTYTLNAIPVSSGGNVTINGQQYVADYVDVERGKLVRMIDTFKLDSTQSIANKTEWLLAKPQEIDLIQEEVQTLKELATYYPATNISVNSEQLDGYTVFNYPISMENGWNYVKQQLNDNRDYIYDMDTKTQDIDTQAAEAYVNSEYAVALTELEV